MIKVQINHKLIILVLHFTLQLRHLVYFHKIYLFVSLAQVKFKFKFSEYRAETITYF